MTGDTQAMEISVVIAAAAGGMVVGLALLAVTYWYLDR